VSGLDVGTVIRKVGAAVITSITNAAAKRSVYCNAIRSECIAHDRAAASHDPEFLKRAKRGDAERDARNWLEAENSYWRALQLHPFHAGYRVQYAHMLKESGKFVEAEFHYRSAVAEGTSRAEVEEHLLFVAKQNGQHLSSIPQLNLQVMNIDAPPTAHDIATLGFLLWHNHQPAITEAIQIIRLCASNREVACRMIVAPRFAHRNALFLDLLRG
jgi:tetratricopeptide (TPR) repeat protein